MIPTYNKEKYLPHLLKAMSRSNARVLSVKTRLSENDDKILDLAQTYVDVMTIHGRTMEELYTGSADWNRIKWFKENTNLYVIGNGDILSKNQGFRYLESGYADAFMIARAAMKNPFVFAEKRLSFSKMLLLYIDFVKKYEPDVSLVDIKQKALQFSHGFENAKMLRAKLSTAKTLAELLDLIQQN